MAGERILVADDSRENREFIIDYILTPNNFQVIEARDGIETLEIARRQNPDLILLDLQMPRLGGRGVLEALQREDISIPVILMTFHGSEEIAVEMFRLGVRDYVKKPYTPEEMLAAIETCLTERRLRKEKDALTQRLLHANRELHSRVKELNALYSIGKSVTGLMNMPQLLARIVEAATVVTSGEEGRLLLLENNQLVLRAVKRLGDEHARPSSDVTQDPLADRAMQTGQPVIFTVEEMASKRQKNPNLPVALTVIPLTVGGRAIGALGVSNVSETAKSFTEHDGALLSALGDYASIAIENARNVQQADSGKKEQKPNVPPVHQTAIIVATELRGSGLFHADDPELTAEMLQDYMTLATEAIQLRDGRVLYSYGDGLLALFENPQRAITAAQALQNGATSLNTAHGISVAFSFGMAMGEVIVGTLGSDVAAVGNTVLLARRLLDMAESGQILMDEVSGHSVGKDTRLNSLGRQKLRGVTALLELFSVK